MGNTNVLLEKEIEDITKTTPFKEQEVRKLLDRYMKMDPEGTDGIHFKEACAMQEFAGCKLATPVISSHLDRRSQTLDAKKFISVCMILSDKITPKDKKDFLYDLLNIKNSKFLSYEDIYRLYKLFFDKGISDNIIMGLVFKALSSPELASKGQCTRQEFYKMITDQEIKDRMTVDLGL